MTKQTQKIGKVCLLATTFLALAGCASLGGNKVVKAPCSPSAGLTDPCGDRAPINDAEAIEDVLQGWTVDT